MSAPAVEATGVVTVPVAGDLTIQNAAEQKARLVEALEQSAELVLDLAGVTELDTAGLQLLLMLRREAAHSDRRLTLTGHPQCVLDVFALANRAADLTDLSEGGTASGTPTA